MLLNLLGLKTGGISDSEIMQKIANAQKNNLNEVEFVTKKGKIIKVSLPNVRFDPSMDYPDSW